MAKGNKDPNKPKRSKSAYNFFVQHQRDENKEPSKSLIQDCAEMWKKMNDEDKKPFTKLAAKDKQRYLEEMADYTPTPQKGEADEKKSRKRKREKDPNQPKRNLSAYFFFSNAERPKVKEENPEIAVTEVAKILGQRWSKLNEKQKEKYQQMAVKDKVRYEEEMQMYRNGEFVLPPSKKVTLESKVEE